jgi:HNH endonuclease
MKVNKTDGCWLWQGASTGNGYGVIWDSTRYEGAHRVSYKLNVGPIPNGLEVCHTCDTPLCVRPNHLFLGTCADNVADCFDKGRRVIHRGSAHPNTTLTEADVIAIRHAYAQGNTTHKQLAVEYETSQIAITQIVSRARWGHLDP